MFLVSEWASAKNSFQKANDWKVTIDTLRRNRLQSSAKSTVAGFVSELSRKARYGIRGEKPLAVIAALKYLDEKGLTGKRLLELLVEPHARETRRHFLYLAENYGRIMEPVSSWDVITGKQRELQDATKGFRAGDVNEAFSRLTAEEIKSLVRSYCDYLARIKR